MKTGLEPVSYWQKFTDAIFLSTPAVWLEEKLTPVNNSIQAVKTKAPIIGGQIVSGVTFGAKYGLIIAGVLLALFLIAEFKSVTAAFKE